MQISCAIITANLRNLHGLYYMQAELNTLRHTLKTGSMLQQAYIHITVNYHKQYMKFSSVELFDS